jgi:hypothetical protein
MLVKRSCALLLGIIVALTATASASAALITAGAEKRMLERAAVDYLRVLAASDDSRAFVEPGMRVALYPTCRSEMRGAFATTEVYLLGTNGQAYDPGQLWLGRAPSGRAYGVGPLLLGDLGYTRPRGVPRDAWNEMRASAQCSNAQPGKVTRLVRQNKLRTYVL